jgi:DNA-binding GntR family transcriptional regulator
VKRRLIEQHQTLREKILDTIREAILNGELKPGEKVAEPELAERFGISRTPIREAFRQLESEGYLTVVPRKGAVVTALSERAVEEFYAIKSILEGYAAQISTDNMTEKDIAKLETLNARLRILAEQGDVKTFFKIHNEFHDVFINASGNEKLAEIIHQMLLRFNRFRLASIALPGRMEMSVKEHDALIKAFRRKDGATADALVRKTASFGGQVLIQSMAQQEGREVKRDILKKISMFNVTFFN